MKRILPVIVILPFLLLNCKHSVNPTEDTQGLPNLSFDEIKNKLTSAKNGDTVYLPAGTCNIPTELRIDANITIKGTGVDKTIFIGNGGAEASLLEIVGHNNNAQIRLSDISFQFPNQAGAFCLRIYGDMANLRIDHCKFENAGRGVYVCGLIYGVIDHCKFRNDGLGVGIERDTDQTTWNSPELLGTANAMYVENCEFEGLKGVLMCAAYCVNGARFVFRYNTVSATEDYTMISIYGGYGKQGTRRGTYSAEIYNNTFIAPVYMYYGLYLRGSRGVAFNNVFTGEFGMPICCADYNSFYYIDPETGDYYGKNYPSPDQINNFYIWNNTYKGNPITDGNPVLYVQDRGYERQNIQNNRDYFENAMPGYTPYTYPHPLAQ